jgi:hypothetical protein
MNNNLHLIDKLVVITDLAKEKADINWNFELMENIDSWEEELIRYLEIIPTYFCVWDIVQHIDWNWTDFEVIEIWLTEDWNWTPCFAITVKDTESFELYDEDQDIFMLVKREKPSI